MVMAMSTVKVPFNPVFRQFNQSRHRYRVAKGSAGSGKSVNVAQDYILKLSDPRYRGANLLVIRKVDATNRYSTYAELRGAIYRIFGERWQRYWRIIQSPLELECKITGAKVIFRGMKDEREREKIKSINFERGKLTWVWCEEATELTEQDIEILDDRLRGILPNPNLYYQMTFTFNPVSATHFIKRRFFDVVHPDIFTHHSTYLDNRFIDEAYHRRMMLRKEMDPDGYRVYGLGEWGEIGGLILTNYVVEEFDNSFGMFNSKAYGQDFGFNHANAILDVGFKENAVYIGDEIYVHEKDTGEIIQLADAKGLSKQVIMWCDSAEPDRIKTWRKAGYKARPVKKEPGSVKAQIDWLKRQKIYVHPRCVNTLKELQQWKWKYDDKLGIYLDEPVEFMDDAMAALRYSTEGVRRGPAVSF
jgi:phage terminase large subunit